MALPAHMNAEISVCIYTLVIVSPADRTRIYEAAKGRQGSETRLDAEADPLLRRPMPASQGGPFTYDVFTPARHDRALNRGGDGHVDRRIAQL